MAITFEEVQKLFPWVVGLPTLPKVVLSVLIAGTALFILLLIWAQSKRFSAAHAGEKAD